VQPDGREQWLFRDATQREVDAGGFSTLGEFLWTPRWASGAPDDAKFQAAPPKDMDDFARYVFRTVSHHRGSIRHWEVWNEPHYSGFWRGTPQQYARLLEIAHREAKKADPGCFVLGGGGVSLGSMRWIEKMLAALRSPSMDGFSIHYVAPEAAAERIAALRRLLDRHGLGRAPIWNTEASVPTTSFLDQNRRGRMEPEARYHFRNACCELVRMYMENLAAGVQRVFYYHQADPWRFRAFAKPRVFENAPVQAGMWGEGRMLRPIAAAHAALACVIEGKTFRRRIRRGPLNAFIFEGPDASAAVQIGLFREFSARQTVRLPPPAAAEGGPFTVADFMGNESPAKPGVNGIVLPLSREPVYLVYQGRRAARLLERLYESAALSAGTPKE